MDFSRYDAITLDCFGTLIDWETGILRCVRPLLEGSGVRAADAEILEVYARCEAAEEAGAYRPYREVLARVLVGIATHFGVAAPPKKRGLLAASLPAWPAFTDVPDALRALKARFRLAVVSNIDDDLFAVTAPKLGAALDCVVTAQTCRSYKPARANFEAVLTALNLPASRVLHAAQSRYHDIAPAKALGMGTVWVNRASAAAGRGVAPEAPPGSEPDLEVPDIASLAALTSRA